MWVVLNWDHLSIPSTTKKTKFTSREGSKKGKSRRGGRYNEAGRREKKTHHVTILSVLAPPNQEGGTGLKLGPRKAASLGVGYVSDHGKQQPQ